MISVLLALYNGEKYIYEQLDSIYKQSYPADEVVIIDDVSKDKSIEIITEYLNKNKINNCRIIRNKINKGYAKNFYDGLKECRGDYIFLADQDDVWQKEKIKKNIEIFENNKDIKAVFSAIEFVNVRLEHINKKFFQCDKKSRFLGIKDILLHCSYMGCGMAIRKKSLSEYFWKIDKLIAHDWAITLDLGSNNGIYYLGEPLVKHRMHNENTSIILDKKKSIVRRKDFEKMILHYNWAEEYTSIIRWSDSNREYIEQLCDFYQIRLDSISNYVKRLNLIRFHKTYKDIYGSYKQLIGDILLIK